jgi:hypothetical protein
MRDVGELWVLSTGRFFTFDGSGHDSGAFASFSPSQRGLDSDRAGPWAVVAAGAFRPENRSLEERADRLASRSLI